MIEAAIARRSFRQVRTGSLVCAVAFGATAASSAVTYVGSFPDAASRAQLAAATRGDAGLSVLLGPIGAIDTVGGYTAYKTFVFLTTIGAIWVSAISGAGMFGVGGATGVIELHELDAPAANATASVHRVEVGADAVGKVLAQTGQPGQVKRLGDDDVAGQCAHAAQRERSGEPPAVVQTAGGDIAARVLLWCEGRIAGDNAGRFPDVRVRPRRAPPRPTP